MKLWIVPLFEVLRPSILSGFWSLHCNSGFENRNLNQVAMVELCIRITTLVIAVGIAYWTGRPNLGLTVQVAAILAIFAGILWRLDLKGLRNPGIAGIVAVVDAMAIAAFLAASGRLDRLGFLVAIPAALAVRFHQAPAISMAPLVGSSILAADAAFRPDAAASPILMIQAASVLGLCLLLPRPVVASGSQSSELTEPALTNPANRYDESVLLRERYRQLRDSYRELEASAERERTVARMLKLKTHAREGWHEHLAEELRQISGAQSVILYQVSLEAQAFAPVAHAGEENEAYDRALETPLDRPSGVLLRDATSAMATLLSEAQRVRTRQILLHDHGRSLGLLVITGHDSGSADLALAKLEPHSSEIAGLVRDAIRRENEWRRLKETELLYLALSMTQGGSRTSETARQVGRELWEVLELDHLGIWSLDRSDAILLDGQGATCQFIDLVRFDGAAGIEGWQSAGSPETVLNVARSDQRLDPEQTLRRRIGSAAIIPLRVGDQVVGFFTAATHREAGIDRSTVEILRSVGVELARGLAPTIDPSGGLCLPNRFYEHVQGRNGRVVVLEPLRRQEIEGALGRAAWSSAILKLSARLRAKLPDGGVISRLDGDVLIAFLPGYDDDRAGRWATEAVATSALVGAVSPDGSRRVPLVVRSKTAIWDKQDDQFLAEMAA
jgi:hypothetical protein